MTFRPRTLISNSVGSLFASGAMILTALLVPAIVARAFTRPELDLFLSVLALLPAMLILPQSHRTVSATQLNHFIAGKDRDAAHLAFVHLTIGVGFAHLLLISGGIELYVALYSSTEYEIDSLRFGLYCLLGYSTAAFLISVLVAPAAAHRDFRPDNIAKLWPGLFQLCAIFIIWKASVPQPLTWAFISYPASAISIGLILFFSIARPMGQNRIANETRINFKGFFLKGLSAVVWWNLTAFLATTAAVMIVAINHRDALAPYSIATSFLGIASAGLIAVSGPIMIHAATLRQKDKFAQRRFFLIVNSAFQAYILIAAFAIALMPVWLFEIWLTAELAPEVKAYSLLLLPATALRLLTMAFTVFVMSAGRQHTLWFGPLVEAITSVIGAILLGRFLGPVGIPMALTLSATVRLFITLVHDAPKNRLALGFGATDLLASGWYLVRARR